MRHRPPAQPFAPTTFPWCVCPHCSIGAFQDVTMRLIAQAILQAATRDEKADIRSARKLRDAKAETERGLYVQGELVNTRPKLTKPQAGHAYHVYCSPHNPPGSKELLDELGVVVLATDRFSQLDQCDQMLVYLNGLTWTRGDASAQLAGEIQHAMQSDLPLLLAHEMVGIGGQEDRHGCEFGEFFASPDGATPQELLGMGIYGKIAIALKGGAWREASRVMLEQAIAASGTVSDEFASQRAHMLANLYGTAKRIRKVGSIVAKGTSAVAKAPGALRRSTSRRTPGVISGRLGVRRSSSRPSTEGTAAQSYPQASSLEMADSAIAAVSSSAEGKDVEIGDGMGCDELSERRV